MRRFVMLMMILWLACPARAVILYRRATRNTTAPTGSYLDSGWQWEGTWGNFSGTVINKKYFITASHIGGQVGQNFVLNGVSYTATATYDDPTSDLQIWKVNHLFKTWAPIYTGTGEKNKVIMIYGRGRQRGDPVVVNNVTKGWLWGQDDHVQSWGKNVVSGLANGLADDAKTKVSKQQLYWTFDANALTNEGGLSAGDSGGGVFAKINNAWQLLGVNYSTQSIFSQPDSDDDLQGSIFDFGGLKVGDTLITDQSVDIPARSFATRISQRMDWIHDVFHGAVTPSAKLNAAPIAQGVPEPTCLGGLLLIPWSLRRPRRAHR